MFLGLQNSKWLSREGARGRAQEASGLVDVPAFSDWAHPCCKLSCCTDTEQCHSSEEQLLSSCQGLCGGSGQVETQGSRGRRTPTHSCRESLRGADYSWHREGKRAGRDPSSAFTEITRSKFLKAHHKLSSIWELLFLAGPTQRLQTRVKQRWAGGTDQNLRKMVKFVLLSQNYILSQLSVCLSFLGKNNKKIIK